MSEAAKPVPVVVKARWGGVLDRDDLCEYLKASWPSIAKEIERGRIPPPIHLAGRNKWRKDDIDRALANLTGEGVSPWRARFERGERAA